MAAHVLRLDCARFMLPVEDLAERPTPGLATANAYAAAGLGVCRMGRWLGPC